MTRADPGARLATAVRRGATFARVYAAGLASAAYLVTLGMRRARNRALLRRLAEDVGVTRPHAPLRLPQVDPAAVAPDDTPVEIWEPAGADGNVSLLELLVLARLVRARGARTVFEIGTFDGRTTLNLAANAPEDAVVHTLDLPPAAATDRSLAIEPSERAFVDKPAPGARFRGRPPAARIRQHLGDSATFDLTAYHGRVDLVFVDGSHAYEYVLGDSERAWAMAAPGSGVVVWHDYGEWPGVTRALEELARRDPRFAALRHVAGTTLAVLDRAAGARDAGGGRR